MADVKLTAIAWRDASYYNDEQRIEEMHRHVDLLTCGQLVAEDDESVSVALDYFDNDKTYRHTEHIPKGMILWRADSTVRVPAKLKVTP